MTPFEMDDDERSEVVTYKESDSFERDEYMGDDY